MFLCRHSIQEMQEDETKTGNGNNLSEADQSIDNFVVTMVGLWMNYDGSAKALITPTIL